MSDFSQVLVRDKFSLEQLYKKLSPALLIIEPPCHDPLPSKNENHVTVQDVFRVFENALVLTLGGAARQINQVLDQVNSNEPAQGAQER